MNKILKFATILILLILPLNTNAHVSHYEDLNRIEFDIYRNNKLIGSHIFSFTKQEDKIKVKSEINFEIKTDTLDDSEIDILFQKMLSILEPNDIISSFNWKAIQSFKDLFVSNYGIIFDKEEELFQAQSLSNHDEDLFFMAHHTLIDSRNFDLPKNKTVLWTVNDEIDFQRYMEMEIYGIVTDIPDTMQLYRK